MIKKMLISLLLIITLVLISYFSLAAKYKYNVAQDYQYALHSSAAKTEDVQLKQGEFTFHSAQEWDTRFIELKITATLSGYFAEPYVEIISQQQRTILSFERGVRGLRYINLPADNMHGSSTIQLIAHHLIIEDQQARVLLFANPVVKKQPRILLISPHPDDAEIAAFGLYSQHNSLILTITAGEAGPHTYAEIYPDIKQHYQAKGKLRVWDSIAVPMLGDIKPEQAINLGYFDSTLQQMAENKDHAVDSIYAGIDNVNFFRQQNVSTLTPETDGKASWSALLNDLKQLIQAYKPDIIISPYPALDWHSDHKFATIAVISAVKQLGLQQGQLWLYTNHFTANNYYPYGAQGELVSIPPDFEQSLYFDSIYSFPLTQPQAKLFALEAMHDLRPDTSYLNIAGAFKLLGKALSNKLLLKDQTYYRRAVRANELFLVVNFSSLYHPETITRLKGMK